MEEKKYSVCVKIGLQTSLEFVAIHSKELSNDGLVYVEIDKNNSIVPERGVLTFNNDIKRIAVAYFGFRMALDVLDIKTVGDCHHFKCVSDLCRVDVYVCNEEEWKKKGEAIFY